MGRVRTPGRAEPGACSLAARAARAPAGGRRKHSPAPPAGGGSAAAAGRGGRGKNGGTAPGQSGRNRGAAGPGELLRCAALVIHRTRRRFPGPLPGPLGGGCRLNLTPGEFPKEVNRGVSNQRRGTGEAARLPKRCCLYISRFTGGFGGGCTGWRGGGRLRSSAGVGAFGRN